MRVYLRELLPSDVNEHYLEWFNNDAVLEFLEVRKGQLTIDNVLAYIKEGRDSESYYMYAVCLKENDKHIGNLKVGPINRKHMLADLVTVIGDKEQWGKGLATDAIKQGNKLAFEKYNVRKLTGGMYEKNIGSIKAYTKAGWLIEGRLQNHYEVDGKLQDRIIVSCFNPCYVK